MLILPTLSLLAALAQQPPEPAQPPFPSPVDGRSNTDQRPARTRTMAAENA